jgi:hypothetical protein
MLEVGAEHRPREPPHVLKDECPWLKLSNGPDEFGNHVPRIACSPVLPGDAEGLTGWTASDQLNLPKIAEGHFPDVGFQDGPLMNIKHATARDIRSQGFASVVVSLD